MSDSVAIKLASGEELFAQVVGIKEDMIILDHIIKVHKKYIETEQGLSVRLNYEPFFDYNPHSQHQVHRSFLMLCEPLSPNLAAIYSQMQSAVECISTTESASSPEPTVVPGSITIH